MGLAADRVRGIAVVDMAKSDLAKSETAHDNGGGRVMHPLLASALVMAASCDSWRWYLSRVAAAPEEAASLALTVIFLAVIGITRMSRPASPRPLPLLTVAIVLTLYAASHAILPPIARAAIAVAATLFCLFHAAFNERPPIAFWGLMTLALPL